MFVTALTGTVNFFTSLTSSPLTCQASDHQLRFTRGATTPSPSVRRGLGKAVDAGRVRSLLRGYSRGPRIQSLTNCDCYADDSRRPRGTAICGFLLTPYAVAPTVQYPALLDAAVAAAAHDILLAMYPDRQGALDATYVEWLDHSKSHHRAKINGTAVGQQTAAAILTPPTHASWGRARSTITAPARLSCRCHVFARNVESAALDLRYVTSTEERL
jgi:hypothetical protein